MIIPNLDFGGAQRSFNSLVNALHENHHLHVCVFNTVRGIAFEHTPKIIDLKIPGGKTLISKTFFFYLRFKAIRTLKKQLKIDTTISYLEGANYLNVLTRWNDKIILSVRGSKYHDPNIRGTNGFIRKRMLIPIIYKYADTIVALNEGIKRELTREFRINDNRVRVIRNFYNVPEIENNAIKPFDEKYKVLVQQPYILYSGRLAIEKGLFTIIDSFNVLVNRMPDLKLVIVGEGPVRQSLVNHARSHGLLVADSIEKLDEKLTRSIYFLGYQANPYNFLKNATILLIGSDTEGGPNILLESMLCETLVLSTDCPYGPREQIAPGSTRKELTEAFEGKFGVLLPMVNRNHYPDTINEWVRAIEYYIKNQTQRNVIITRAKQYALQYSQGKILAQWDQII